MLIRDSNYRIPLEFYIMLWFIMPSQWSRNEFHVGGGHFHIPSSVQFQCKQSMQEVFPSQRLQFKYDKINCGLRSTHVP